jgi:pilus assembly protein CpaB
MRSKIIFVLAILMGLVTTVLFFNYMKKYDQGKVVNETLSQIIVAKAAIKKNQLINSSMVEITKVPKKGIYAQTARKLSDITGKFATVNFKKGEPILLNHLQKEKDETLLVSRKIHKGYRAISVGANFVQTNSNLIEPEDHVDVISSVIDKKTKKIKTTMILKDIRVLAVGRLMIEPSKDTKYVQYSSVTLEVTPEQTLSVVKADQQGSIYLALHTRIIPPSSKK